MEGRPGILCALIAALALTIAPVVSQRIQTVELGGSRYFISNTSPYSPQLNWFLAYQYCQTIGMELLSIGTEEEKDILLDHLIENNYMASDYWTSGNQLGSQMWLWMSSGQPFNSTWSSWAPPGAPLVKGNKGCVSQIKGIWSAQNCMDNKHFICEQTRCFYFNYVTTNRGQSSGAQPTQG